jgi:hypothetical protein
MNLGQLPARQVQSGPWGVVPGMRDWVSGVGWCLRQPARMNWARRVPWLPQSDPTVPAGKQFRRACSRRARDRKGQERGQGDDDAEWPTPHPTSEAGTAGGRSNPAVTAVLGIRYARACRHQATAQPRYHLAMRRLLNRMHNPAGYSRNCASWCWCQRSRMGRAVRWYVPAWFHKFPPGHSRGEPPA